LSRAQATARKHALKAPPGRTQVVKTQAAKTHAAKKPRVRNGKQGSKARSAHAFAARGAGASGGRMSLTDEAYEAIKRKIITLEYRPGQYLNEVQVCKSLGIGRTPVHQALHRLMLERLVEIIPRKGLIVRPDSLNEVLALLEARWVIEPYCAGLVVARATRDDIEALRVVIDKARTAAEAADTEAFMSLDVAFHATLSKVAGNQILSELLRTLHDRATRIWYLHVWQRQDMLLTQQEHAAIFEAVARSDKDAAISAMQNHLSSLRRRILQAAD
jgi:DNA-binding GntR family transcriptional regulator